MQRWFAEQRLVAEACVGVVDCRTSKAVVSDAAGLRQRDASKRSQPGDFFFQAVAAFSRRR
jgi:hypothetical protein